jgi:hypothetical protein
VTRQIYPHTRRDRIVTVFVAACSGSARLSQEVGLPVVHVDASFDPEASIRRLNAREHGSGVRVPNLFQPIGFDCGWSDWNLFAYEHGPFPNGSERPDGVRAQGGRILVSLPAGAVASEFCEHLHAALRHRRFQDVTISMPYLEARSADLADYVVHPRYTPNEETRGFRGATVCHDLYVIDPAEDPWSLLWAVVGARMAAIQGGLP